MKQFVLIEDLVYTQDCRKAPPCDSVEQIFVDVKCRHQLGTLEKLSKLGRIRWKQSDVRCETDSPQVLTCGVQRRTNSSGPWQVPASQRPHAFLKQSGNARHTLWALTSDAMQWRNAILSTKDVKLVYLQHIYFIVNEDKLA